ncbi:MULTISPECIES: GAF domain-containing protein [Streptomyces]|uniref:GAF domain-containing protein n=1 Tax=Streptomyces sudanensis TaxID=436397 RepID=A0ABY4TJ59_9ACTN|nr:MULTISPECIES: GAF domain-containing protein [Streptomyces]MCP9956463.1 GAF domain-containing protein [Streptomyces sudanensis]MCQ0002925.1 GAF domain-containing protein [Streptomyces sudanensis]URN17686.1 GAF domain-containing protein [Streptomyces sudanensis]
MTYDPTGHLLLTPVDREAPARVLRLRQLGLGEYPDPAFDAFAARLAEVTGAPYSMVNFIDENRQFFAGLHTPTGTRSGLRPGADPAASGTVGRYMARDHGYCPHVVVRRKALVLEDVCDYPRFAGNPVVDEIGIRSYLGAPLIDRTGTTLGTICVVDTEPRPWGRAGLETIKSLAAELVEQIHQREDGGL